MKLTKIVCFLLALIFFCSSLLYAEGVSVENLAKSTTSWNGVSLPDFGDGETEITVLRISVEPHTKLPMHFHPVINIAYMLEGKLSVFAKSGEKKVISAGEPLIELVNQDHYGVNETDEPVRLVVVYLGKQGKPITVKQ